MKGKWIIPTAISAGIGVVFGIIGLAENRRLAKQQREALCAQLHADILGAETQMLKEMAENVNEFKLNNGIQNNGGEES